MFKSKSKHYNLDKIRPYRLLAIDEAVYEFKKTFRIKNAPIDCVKLAIDINKQNINIQDRIRFKSTKDLPPHIVGRTIYVRELRFYFVSINFTQLYDKVANRIKYPFRYSSDRMLNFTIAHEFGHIFLNHADIPDSCKTSELKSEEDLEADEFAGRLLMPQKQIESCSFNSLSIVAKEFLVSESAVQKRLTHLGKHEKKYSKPFPVCQNCGNSEFNQQFDYCPICGVSLIDRKMGVLTMNYTDKYNLDDYGRAYPCPRCGNSDFHSEDRHCRICGMYLYNQCTNDYCNVSDSLDGSSRYCYNCGYQTTFLNNGILNDWEPSREALLNMLQKEEDICGLNNIPNAISDIDWLTLIYHLSNRSNYVSDLLEGSYAKQYKNRLLIYVRSTDIENKLNQPKYRQLLIDVAIGELSIEIDEIHILAYENYLPIPNPIDNDFDIPF